MDLKKWGCEECPDHWAFTINGSCYKDGISRIVHMCGHISILKGNRGSKISELKQCPKADTKNRVGVEK